MKHLLNLLAISPAVIAGIAAGAVAVIAVVIVAIVVVKARKNHAKDALSVEYHLKPSLPAAKEETPSEVPETAFEQPAEPSEETPAEPDETDVITDEVEAVENQADELLEELEVLSKDVDEYETADKMIEEAAPADEVAAASAEAVAVEEEIEEPVEEVVEEPAAEVVEQPIEEVVEQPIEEVVEEPVEEVVEEPVEEVVEQPVEEVVEQPIEEVVEEPVEEIVEEPVEDVAEEAAAEAAEAAIEAEEEDDEDEPQVPEEVQAPRVAPEGKIFVKVRYNRSLTAKIIQSNDTVKSYYSEIKNELMRYGVKSRMSWKHETFRSGRKLLARMQVRGKTLCVYLALNPEDYADTKYKILDVSSVARNKEVPLLYKIKNERRLKYVKDLIADVMTKNELAAKEIENVDYASQYPYEELEPLIDRNLVKLLPWKEVATGSEVGVIAVSIDELPPEVLMGQVSVTEAEDMFIGENVDALVKTGSKYSDKTKKAIINIDTLGRYFGNGDTVTVEEIKKRVPDIGKRVTYIKVLARGTLDKALTVEADDFSPAAIKMIVLTGGQVIKTKANLN